MEFGKRLVLLSSLVVSVFVFAGEENEDWYKRSKQIVKDVETTQQPAWLVPDQEKLKAYQDVVEDIALRSREEVRKQFTEDSHFDGISKDNKENGLYVFVSGAMPSSELRIVLNEAGLSGATVVFRGLRPGMKTVSEMIRFMHALSKDFEKAPSVILDPTMFTEYAVTQVPVLLYKYDDGSVIRATGSVSFDYLQREAEGLTGVTDLGRFGTTWDIEERDFIEEMKSRLAGIDMKKMAEKSWDGYWERAQFIDLPDTDEGRMLKIDPSFVITRNVFAPSGEIIARRGQVYNPLKIVPMTSKLIIFDASNDDHLAFVKREIENNTFAKVKLITTRINRGDGWKHLQEVEDSLKHPVYLLQQDFADRFHLTVVPSIVVSDGENWILSEYSKSTVADLSREAVYE